MSDTAFTPPPAFKYAFAPGEQVNDAEYDRFERYVPRQTDETSDAYATRLEGLGLVVKVTASDARDFVRFRAARQSALARGLPLALVTSPAPTIPTAADLANADAAKQAALDAARAAARGSR
jgi:hypothetical protein